MAGTQAESSGNAQGDDIPQKKKRLSFKAFRQLFSRRKRAKSSTEKIAEEEESEAGALTEQKHLSLSHDSVFMEKSGSGGAEGEENPGSRDASRSMTNLLPHPRQGRSVFSAELSQAVKGRRQDGDDEEEEVIISDSHTRLKSENAESDHSMMSVGDSSGEELEEEFFKSGWTGPAGTKISSSEQSDDNELDLNMVQSCGSLNTQMLGHRRDVRPKKQRPQSRHPRASTNSGTARSNSPKPPAGSVQVLPQLKEDKEDATEASGGEEEKAKDEKSEEPSSPETAEAKGTEAKSTEAKSTEAKSTEAKNTEAKSTEAKSIEAKDTPKEIVIAKPTSPQISPRSSESTSPTPGKTSPTPKATSPTPATNGKKDPEFRSVILRKASQREVKVGGDGGSGGEGAGAGAGAEKGVSENKVILRPGLRHDPSKRTTIVGVGVDVSIFGERKIGNKRSSLTEAKDWEDGARQDGEKTNEFATVFNKFRGRRESLKSQKEGESSEEKQPKEKEEVKKSVKPSDGVKIQSSNSKTFPEKKVIIQTEAAPVNKAVPKEEKKVEIITKPSIKKVEPKKEEKPKEKTIEIITKSSATSVEKPKEVKPAEKKIEFITKSSAATVEAKPKEDKPPLKKIELVPKTTESDTKPSPKPLKTVASGDEKQSQKKVEIVPKTTPTDRKPAGKTMPPAKTVTLVIEKDSKDAKDSKDTTESNENKENKEYKRPSPLLKNRARSQTLPDRPTSTTPSTLTTEKDLDPKKSPGTTTSPQRSSSVLLKSSSQRVQPKRLIIPAETGSGGGGGGSEPAWFEAARKKRSAFTDDQPKDQKEQENNAKKNEEETKASTSQPETNNTTTSSTASSRKSVLDMVSRWQQPS